MRGSLSQSSLSHSPTPHRGIGNDLLDEHPQSFDRRYLHDLGGTVAPQNPGRHIAEERRQPDRDVRSNAGRDLSAGDDHVEDLGAVDVTIEDMDLTIRPLEHPLEHGRVEHRLDGQGESAGGLL